MLTLLWELWWRSAALLVVAEALQGTPRFLTAAQGHRVLTWGFMLLVTWPVLALCLPAIALNWLSNGAAPGRGTVTVSQVLLGPARGSDLHDAARWVVLVWLLGALAALLPLAKSRLRLRRLERDAIPITACTAEMKELCERSGLRKCPDLLQCPGTIMPMAAGIVRARILLPPESNAWTDELRRCVLLHELAHVFRRDVATQTMARCVAALWWFQPLAWIALGSLRRASERACDAAVLRSGMRASDYAAGLLTVARTFGRDHAGVVAAVGMSRRPEVSDRIRGILEFHLPTASRRRLAMASLLLVISAVAVSAVTAAAPNPLQSSKRIFVMRRTLFSTLFSAAGLSAATLSGSVFDSSGKALPDASALLYNPDTMARLATATAADGEFAFDQLPAGQYILKIDKPGFAPIFREFDLKQDAKVERHLTARQTAIDETPEIRAVNEKRFAEAQTGSPGVIRVGTKVVQENLTRQVPPTYPASAKAAGIQGPVVLNVVISKEGIPEDVQVMSSPSDDLSQSALESVRQWRYNPVLLNGQPVDVSTQITVTYSLTK